MKRICPAPGTASGPSNSLHSCSSSTARPRQSRGFPAGVSIGELFPAWDRALGAWEREGFSRAATTAGSGLPWRLSCSQCLQTSQRVLPSPALRMERQEVRPHHSSTGMASAPGNLSLHTQTSGTELLHGGTQRSEDGSSWIFAQDWQWPARLSQAWNVAASAQLGAAVSEVQDSLWASEGKILHLLKSGPCSSPPAFPTGPKGEGMTVNVAGAPLRLQVLEPGGAQPRCLAQSSSARARSSSALVWGETRRLKGHYPELLLDTEGRKDKLWAESFAGCRSGSLSHAGSASGTLTCLRPRLSGTRAAHICHGLNT
ncbi:uncharacterized protein LOC113969553 [Neopelma chrysocephalum]|uniref:uncharacterized protein LOC113969553 n=1 Tax=Neopelma chrysocephalum TaxID=114329 RepID=UPI000FCD4999|nr:uncharacterized protein LOC113969553 [Neopelma chrysocephalum]